MATLAQRKLARQHQKSITRINNAVQTEVMRLVNGFAGEPFPVIKDALRELVPVIAQDYGDAAASLALDYYEMAREAAEIPGFVSLPDAAKVNNEAVDSSIRWSLRHVTGELPSLELLSTELGASISRKVLDVDAETIRFASVKDKRSIGWSRLTDGNACEFCQMLADRGGVYTGATVRFASHDHCGCTAMPLFNNETNYRPVSTLAFQASQRRLSDPQRSAMKTRVREYLAANY